MRTRPHTTASRLAVISVTVLVAFGLAARRTSLAAQTATIRGRAVDVAGPPVAGALVMLAGTSYSTTTGEAGEFALTNLPAGAYTLRFSHIAYGEKTVAVELSAGEVKEVRLTLSETAIELQAIDVRAESVSDDRQRRLGVTDGRISREQIAALENTNATLADVLQRYMPAIRVRRAESVVGSQTCIELRSIRSSGAQPACLSPAVYLDGVPITNPTYLYSTLNIQTIEGLQVVPAAEAGVRYGSGALYGALIIETRRPGRPTQRTGLPTRSNDFDWNLETNPHRVGRAYLFAFAGNVIGLAAGYTAARQCIALREPAQDAIITHCSAGTTIAAAFAGLAFPAIGSSFGAGLGGRTGLSRGQLLPAAAGATMALLPGYALALTSQRSNSEVIGVSSAVLLALGAPLAATIADRLFRSMRN